MVFGLCNAPGSFQACMSYILQGLANTIYYLDDVLLYSKNAKEHMQQLDALLLRLNKYNLKVSINKCQLFKKEAKYLRFFINVHSIRTDPIKTEALLSWNTPSSAKEV